MSQIEATTESVAAIAMKTDANAKTTEYVAAIAMKTDANAKTKLDALDETKSQTAVATDAADEPSSIEEEATNRCVGDKAARRRVCSPQRRMFPRLVAHTLYM